MAKLHKLLKTAVEVQLARYCGQKVPARLQDRIRMTFRIHGIYATLFEERLDEARGLWLGSTIAQLRYGETDGTWSLYWRNGDDNWQRWEDARPIKDLKALLQEIDRNPHGVFFA